MNDVKDMKDVFSNMTDVFQNTVANVKRAITSDDEKDDASITFFSKNSYIQSVMERITHIEATHLNEITANGEKVTILDIRQPSEFTKTRGMKGNILNIPRNLLEIDAYEKLQDKKASIVVVSSKGISSSLASYTLKNMGYTNISNLKDGIEGWKQAKKKK